MRYLRSLIVIVLMTLSSSTVHCATWAVVVGINGYKSANPLNYAVADAQAFYDLITDPNLGKVSKDHVRLLVDGTSANGAQMPSRQAITAALDETVKATKPGDRLIFLFTGHGICVENKSYLMPIDGDGQDHNAVISSCLSAEEITSRISSSGASEVLLFLDACRKRPDGARDTISKDQLLTDEFAKAFRIQPRVGGPKMTATFYACSVGEAAWEWPEQKHGVFSYYCLEGLKGRAAPRGKTGVTLNELQQYVGDEITRHKLQFPNHNQTPWVVVNGQAGSLVLSYANGEPIVEPSIKPQFQGRIAVMFPADEDCKAKSALIDALVEKGYDAVDGCDNPGKPIKVKIVGKQRFEKRTTDAYGLQIDNLDNIVSIKIIDAKAGRSLGSHEETGSIAIIGAESKREADAAERTAAKLVEYVAKCLDRI